MPLTNWPYNDSGGWASFDRRHAQRRKLQRAALITDERGYNELTCPT